MTGFDPIRCASRVVVLASLLLAAVLTEYFDVLGEPDGSQWLVVKSIGEDPAYLAVAPITSSNFRKQTDRSGWDPQACSAR